MKTKRVPLRKCIGCQEMKPKRELLRIVKSVDNVIHIDETGKMPGRGAYVCRGMECYQKALKGKRIQKAFQVPVSKDLYNEIKKYMEDVNGSQQ
jgi:predicted RNA-binding protein YlxR (DUF448 family)